jgi:hypothetical protein
VTTWLRDELKTWKAILVGADLPASALVARRVRADWLGTKLCFKSV